MLEEWSVFEMATCSRLGDLQIGVHFLEGPFGLSKEIVYYALTELSLIFVIIHFEDLVVRCQSNQIIIGRRVLPQLLHLPARKSPGQSDLQNRRS